MNDDRKHLDPIESGLVELQAMNEAGVFDSTEVDPRIVLDMPRGSSTHRLRFPARRWLSAAAMIVVAVGLWGVLFHSPTLVSPPIDTTTAAAPDARFGLANGSIMACLSGPRDIAQGSRCESHDYDADGDVDLADFQTFQVAYLGPESRFP